MDKSFLMKRGDVWWYNRRIPKRFAHLDDRKRIRKSLDTYSLEEACLLREKFVDADNQYWASLALVDLGDGEGRNAALAHYSAAVSRAEAAGFSYRPVLEIASEEALPQILDRVLAIRDQADAHGVPEERTAEAILGGTDRPQVKVSEALDIYFNEIALDDQMYKSENQKSSWRKTKELAIRVFVEAVSDLPIDEITRDHALAYKAWWADRVFPKDPSTEPSSGDTANRRIGDIRSLYREYYKHIGQEDRPNPFRSINFKSRQKIEVASFEVDWVRNKILRPNALKGLNSDLILIVYMLIETGCRPSEIINLRPDDIQTSAEVPHLIIRPHTHGQGKRELKSASSERVIPLVGVSLEAARRAPNGFPRYQDKSDLFSANALRAFKRRGLFPTKAHRIYSFRHSFEKRMQEANIDYGLRCLLMGHKTDRPAYGDGGSLSYRRDELMKIVHPYSDELFAGLDAAHAGQGLAS
ncbi:MAG: DUF6538 domain-containing protein [Hyphomonadaceae bacterium]